MAKLVAWRCTIVGGTGCLLWQNNVTGQAEDLRIPMKYSGTVAEPGVV